MSEPCISVITRRTRFSYRNHRGETSMYYVEPLSVWYGVTRWHPEMQWFMRATDIQNDVVRDFAMRDIRNVSYE